MRSISLLIYPIFIVLFFSACDDEKIETNMSENVADFEFTTQDNETFERKDLENEWWIAYFLYTDCGIVCPTTTPNMVSLQKELKDAGVDINIVSFTVDPEHDTPEVLKKYAEESGANWTFLTGYDFDDIKELSEESFQSALAGGGPEGMEYSHTTNFFLINSDDKIIKKYDGMSSNEVDKLISDVKTIMK